MRKSRRLENYLRLTKKSAAKIVDHRPRLNLQGFSDIDELDDIEPTFPTLVLADEGLRTAQLLCQIDLRQLGFMPSTDQGSAQLGAVGSKQIGPHRGLKPIAVIPRQVIINRAAISAPARFWSALGETSFQDSN